MSKMNEVISFTTSIDAGAIVRPGSVFLLMILFVEKEDQAE